MQRIVHLGLGNFHRAHQAWYTAKAGGWHITGVIMSNRALRDQLAEHGNRYLLGIWGKNSQRAEKISIYDDVLLSTEQSDEVIKRISDLDTHIVTLTVTEKGYYLRPEDSRLDMGNEAILHDLVSNTPNTAIGLLAAGLISRAKTHAQPLTILSCDNLADNGHKLRQAIVDYLAQKSPDTITWLQKHVTFPNSMVDRITPKLSKTAITEIKSLTDDKELPIVGTEAFSEWVIEDSFLTPRPDWTSVGVEIVQEVASFEQRKLRLLNASHSYLAYAGLLAGHQYVHEAIADSELKAGVNALWDEASTTVSEPAADTLNAYRSALLDRFAVVEIRHDLNQIAMDGSLKLRERLIPILKTRSKAQLNSPQTCKAIAAWIAFIQTAVKNGDKLNDPYAGELIDIFQDTTKTQQCYDKLATLIGLQPEWVSQIADEAIQFLSKPS